MNEHRDNSERLAFDFHKISAEMYAMVTEEVISEFKLEAANDRTTGLDEIFQDFKKDNEVVGLEWDIWSGYIVNAKTNAAEALVREIAGYISAKFDS